jgi:glycosyltransferase involved in cell wall biosynthesis
MFAYNESANIANSIKSIYDNTDDRLNHLHLIANGCSDNTVDVANACKETLGFDKLIITDLSLGDKCNAWNHYVYTLAEPVPTHFFVDADVKFSANCFPLMHDKLITTPAQTVTIAGMPLSGRNLDFYRSLVINRACFFGNLYGLKYSFIETIRQQEFTLPIGLNWIDSFLTKAVNTELQFFDYNLPERTTYLEGTGYYFDSLSPFNIDDIKLYINRIARYELGKLQEVYLDKLPVKDWPKKMHGINLKIARNFASDSQSLSTLKKYLVKRRLTKLVNKGM